AMREIVLGDDDQATGGFVETMNDAGPKFAADLGKMAETVQQRVDQRATIAFVIRGTGTSVHHHAGGLVDDGEVVVFIDNVKRNIFGGCAERRWRSGTENFNLLAAAQAQRRLGSFFVNQDHGLFDKLLHAGAADFGQAADEELIEPASRVVG